MQKNIFFTLLLSSGLFLQASRHTTETSVQTEADTDFQAIAASLAAERAELQQRFANLAKFQRSLNQKEQDFNDREARRQQQWLLKIERNTKTNIVEEQRFQQRMEAEKASLAKEKASLEAIDAALRSQIGFSAEFAYALKQKDVILDEKEKKFNDFLNEEQGRFNAFVKFVIKRTNNKTNPEIAQETFNANLKQLNKNRRHFPFTAHQKTVSGLAVKRLAAGSKKLSTAKSVAQSVRFHGQPEITLDASADPITSIPETPTIEFELPVHTPLTAPEAPITLTPEAPNFEMLAPEVLTSLMPELPVHAAPEVPLVGSNFSTDLGTVPSPTIE